MDTVSHRMGAALLKVEEEGEQPCLVWKMKGWGPA